MGSHEAYNPGPASGAEVQKSGDRWTLVIVRDLRHPPARVWEALTDPAQLREWAPFDSDRNLGSVGTVQLSTVGAPVAHLTETHIRRAEPNRVLEYNWGGQEIRWELQPLPDEAGTRLTLWHNIDRDFVSMGAAGWHICLDVMERHLEGRPIGRLVAGDALKFDGWQRLNVEYAQQFGVKPPRWGAGSAA